MSINLQITSLLSQYKSKSLTPRQVIHHVLEESDRINDNPIWIRRLTIEELEPYLQNLDNKSVDELPLYGIPFAIKDNIDLLGIPTTAACAAFAYEPQESAFVVQQLIAAGAIPIGKTNLDQFATGLVGVRSPKPWGPCKNSLHSDYISGGSSSGSSLAVSLGLVSFSLGTDTAGSGRVPASLNNIVGLKPSCGLLSTRGVVPACRSLDCVSIFALSTADANSVFDVAAVYDKLDPYSRKNPYKNSLRYGLTATSKKIRIGFPSNKYLEFFGNEEAENLFFSSLELIKRLDVELVEINFEPFLQSAKLLYEGPWVAERYLATKPLIDDAPQLLLPVIQTIISGGKKPTAADGFSAQYKLNNFAQQALAELESVDAIITPTNGTIYTIKDVLANPIQLNSNLGYYTNFMNLLDCSAIAVPTGFYKNGVGFGITLFHQAFNDKNILSISNKIQQLTQFTLGATPHSIDNVYSSSSLPSSNYIDLLVCGAHLHGCVLNWQLTERGGYLITETQTSDKYRFYALADGPPLRPGLVRHPTDGVNIDVEVWRMPIENFGSFVAEIPAPLGIGKVELVDGSWVSGFICDGYGLDGAKDISAFGSWRAFLCSINTQ